MKPLALIQTLLLSGTLAFAAGSARADMTIEIVGGGMNQYPLGLPVFVGENALPGGLTPIIKNDLARTGAIRFVDASSVPNLPGDPSQLNATAWKSAGAFAVAYGKVAGQSGNTGVQFWLTDVGQKKAMTGGTFQIQPAQSRQLAHKIADMIYEAITGERGVAGTQIAYIAQRGRSSYELRVADADGSNEQTILRSKEPLISPKWSPDGSRLAYVSFETKKPVVYVHNVATGARRAVANFKGSNSAPAWSPDGSKLAVVLTRDGNSQIYSINADGSGVLRLSHSQGIDTEPAWTPDGRIVFVSDRAGGPQLYAMSAQGGAATRLTWEGNYNVSPAVSPDGKSFTFVRREGGRYRVMVQDFGSSQANYVSDTQFDESPSFAPNGKLILYATEQGGRGVLYAVSRDGSTKTRLAASGDVQEPAWGPFPR